MIGLPEPSYHRCPGDLDKMYQIGPKLRFIFHSLALIAAGLAISVAGLAAAAPYLLKSPAVRASIVQTLSARSGANVEIKGGVRIANPFTLAIEAKDVRLSAKNEADPVRRLKGRRVRANVSLPALLRGRLEFGKMTILSPKVVLQRDFSAELLGGAPGPKVLAFAAALADRAAFDDLILKEATVYYAEDARKPLQKLSLARVNLSRTRSGTVYFEWKTRDDNQRLEATVRLGREDGGKSPLDVWIKSPTLNATFQGSLDLKDEAAAGHLSLALSPGAPAPERIVSAALFWDAEADASFTGEMTWSRNRVALDDASMQLGAHKAKGSLALAFGHGRTRLEGTLAYDDLDVSAFIAIAPDWKNPVQLLPAATDRYSPFASSRRLDLDLRLSADRVRSGEFTAGPLALALTAHGGRISADLAELGVLGGSVSGRVTYDPLVSSAIVVKASGRQLDGPSVTSAFSPALAVKGKMDVTLDMTIPNLTVDALASAQGGFTVALPAGGAVEGDALQQFSDEADSQDFALPSGGSSLSLSSLSVDGKFGGGAVEAKIEGESGNARLSGPVRIAANGALGGSVVIERFQPSADAPDAAAQTPGQLPPAKIVLSGSATKPDFLMKARPNLSN